MATSFIAAPDAIVEQAKEQTGLTDLGADGWQVGLDHLVGAVESDLANNRDAADLIERTAVTRLVNRLRIEDWYAKHGDEAAEGVEGPVMILGLPRTATTALHYLLAVDGHFVASADGNWLIPSLHRTSRPNPTTSGESELRQRRAPSTSPRRMDPPRTSLRRLLTSGIRTSDSRFRATPAGGGPRIWPRPTPTTNGCSGCFSRIGRRVGGFSGRPRSRFTSLRLPPSTRTPGLSGPTAIRSSRSLRLAA